jgi:hypothetical protein
MNREGSMSSKIQIVRAIKTGKLHMGFPGTNATSCNNGFSVSGNVGELEIARAHEKRFCRKCFPNGRPAPKKKPESDSSYLDYGGGGDPWHVENSVPHKRYGG